MQINLELKKYSFAEKPSQILSTLGFNSAKTYTLNNNILSFEDDRTQADIETLLNNSAKLLYLNKEFLKQKLDSDYNSAKKITILGSNTLIIKHDTAERDDFLKLIEDVSNLSKLKKKKGVFIYKQTTDAGDLALRILPEIAAYIFEDLFVATLNNPLRSEVNSRVHNKTTVYDNALGNINNATTQSELNAVTWHFLNPAGITIDTNAKAAEMLADSRVSDFAKAAINAVKDPVTGEIYLIKPLRELAADS